MASLRTGDAEQKLPHGGGRAAERMHGLDREGVRALLGVACIRRVEQAARDEYHGRRAGDVAEQKSDQERHAAALEHQARLVAMADMADFMGDDAGDLVRALGLLQQPVEQINFAARQRERIGYRRRQHLGLQRHVHMAGLTQRFDKLGESGVAFRIGAGPAAEYRPAPDCRPCRRDAVQTKAGPAASAARRRAARRRRRSARSRRRRRATRRRCGRFAPCRRVRPRASGRACRFPPAPPGRAPRAAPAAGRIRI